MMLTRAPPASSDLLDFLSLFSSHHFFQQAQSIVVAKQGLLTESSLSSLHMFKCQLPNSKPRNSRHLCEFVYQHQRQKDIFQCKDNDCLNTFWLLQEKSHKLSWLTKQRNILFTIPEVGKPKIKELAFRVWCEPTSWLIGICLMCPHMPERVHMRVSDLFVSINSVD